MDPIRMAAAHERIANSIRLAYVIIRLAASIEESFGNAVLDILKRQYPDQSIDVTPNQVGNKLMQIAKRQLQNNPSDSMDAVQDLLTYLSTGSRFETDEETGRSERKTKKEWDFTKDWKTWKEALSAIYSNMRTTSMGRSMNKSRKKKFERSVDDAFGKRPEGGGAPEGGEASIPDVSEGELSNALDDRSAVKEFMEYFDEYVPRLRAALSENTQKMFDLIFYDEIGSFGSDVKENMNQASAMKEKYPELYEKYSKRWSGFVGDTRKQLLKEIHNFIENKLPQVDYDTLYEYFFSDVTPAEAEKGEIKKKDDRDKYQRGVDERKLADWKWMEQNNVLPPNEKKPYDNLTKKLKDQGVDVEAIEPKKPDQKKLDRLGIPDPDKAAA